MLEVINKWWREKEVPLELTQARVVLLYKKGSTADLANYRPISLLNAIYKVVASILKVRLEKGSRGKAAQTQFGFRKGKGTANAIQIIRRTIDKGNQRKPRRCWCYWTGKRPSTRSRTVHWLCR